MLRPTIMLVGVAAVATALIYVLAAPASTPYQRVTYKGKTAFQWHRIAVKRRLARDDLQHRLAARVLEIRALHHAIRRLSSQDSLLTSAIERNLLCIHAHEAVWDDAGGPYWGGMQMDLEFQKTYGREFYDAWGTADHWPVSVQITVAIRAYLEGRRYGPWPTRRYCGL